VFTLPPTFDESYYGEVIHEIREMQIAGMGQYAHGNQPIQHMIYLYDYAGAPWKTQYWAREVMNRLYRATPDGYCGDEDNGQTSAWYVFSALGFYPVTPAPTSTRWARRCSRSASCTWRTAARDIEARPATATRGATWTRCASTASPVERNWLGHKELMRARASTSACRTSRTGARQRSRGGAVFDVDRPRGAGAAALSAAAVETG
jgi:putative alpha-1,2-mannosidase